MAIAVEPAPARGLVHAPFGARLAALALDWLVSFIIISLFVAGAGLYLLLASDMAEKDVSDRTLVNAVLVATLAAPVWCVVTLAGYTWHGRSPGKLAMNLRVVGGDLQPPGVLRALIRLVVYIAEVLPVAAVAPVVTLAVAWRSSTMTPQLLLAVGVALVIPTVSLVLVLRDGRRRALHDIAAGTMVISD